LGVRGHAAPSFAAVRIAAEPGVAGRPGAGLIDIEFAAGGRMRIAGVVDPATLTVLLTALAGGRRR
jgi:hypothetical protein